MLRWLALPVLLLSCIKFSMSLLLHRILWFVLSPLSTRLNLSKVAWGKGANAPHSRSSHTLWFCFLFLHLLPLLSSAQRGTQWEFSPVPKPCHTHPHSILTKTHHPSLTPARLCSIRGCKPPTSCPVPLAQGWQPGNGIVVRQCSSLQFSFTAQRTTGILHFLSLSLSPLSATCFLQSTEWKSDAKCFQKCPGGPGFCWFWRNGAMLTISWSWTMPVALQPQHKAQAIRYKEVLEVHRCQPNALASSAITAICWVNYN